MYFIVNQRYISLLQGCENILAKIRPKLVIFFEKSGDDNLYFVIQKMSSPSNL